MKKPPRWFWILLAIPVGIAALGFLMARGMNDPEGPYLPAASLIVAAGGTIFVVWLVWMVIAGGVREGIRRRRP